MKEVTERVKHPAIRKQRQNNYSSIRTSQNKYITNEETF